MNLLGVHKIKNRSYQKKYIVRLSEREICALFDGKMAESLNNEEFSFETEINLEPRILEINQAYSDQFKLIKLKESLKNTGLVISDSMLD